MAVSETEPESEGSQFVPRSDDEENLWEILGIVGESRTKYKVKWAGDDPATGKPWGNSWVDKKDVTPDVVQEWKEKQALKAQRDGMKRLSKSGAKKKSTPSTASNRTATTATVRRGRSSMAATAKQGRTASPSTRSHESPPPAPSISASPRKAKGKRKLSIASSFGSDDFPVTLTSLLNSEPRKKKRKVSEEPQASTSAVKLKPKTLAVYQPEEEEETTQEAEATRPINTKQTSSSSRSRLNTKGSTTEPRKDKGKGRAKDLPDEKQRKKKKKKEKEMVVVVSDDEDGSDWYPAPDVPSRVPSAKSPAKAAKQKLPVSGSPGKPKSGHKRKAAVEEDVSDSDPGTAIELREPKAGHPVSLEALLSPGSQKRLADWDVSMMRLDEELGSGSEQPHATVPYGESDVDTVAAGVMYPSVEDIPHHASPPPSASRPTPLTPRSSLISRMKPRTPKSSSTKVADDDATSPEKNKAGSSGASKPKIFGPIPQISPSKFHPHLPSSSNIMNSTIEDAEPEVEEPMSSIEQFDSPQKPTKLRFIPPPPNRKKGKERATNIAVPFWSSPGLEPAEDRPALRGEDIYEKFKAKAQTGPAPTKRTLEEVFQRHRASSNAASTRSAPRSPSLSPPPQLEEGVDLPVASPSPPSEEGADGLPQEARSSPLPDEENDGPQQHARSSPIPEEEADEMVHEAQSSPPPANEDSFELESLPSLPSSPQQGKGVSLELEPASFPSPPPEEEESMVEDALKLRSPEGEEVSLVEQTQIEVELDDIYVDEPTVYEDSQTLETQGQPPTAAPPRFVPEEDEETTQDLLHEMEIQRAVSEGVPSRTPTPPQEPIDITEPDSQELVDPVADVSMEPQPGTLPEPLDLSMLPESQDPPLPEFTDIVEAQVIEGTQEIPATAPVPAEEYSQESNETNATVDSTDQKKHIGYMSLLNAKSEEIDDLSKQLQEEREKNAQYALAIANLEQELRVAKLSAEQNAQAAEYQEKYEASNAQLVQELERSEVERAAWAKEREELVKRAELSKADHDKVHGMFYEQYNRVGQLGKEKKELQKELTIARSQADEGVKTVREMFRERVKDLERDRNDWKRAAEFIMKKDARTNDDIRRRAAEEPELREKVQTYKYRIAKKSWKIDELKRDKDDLIVEVKKLRKQLGILPVENGNLDPGSISQTGSPEGDDEVGLSQALVRDEEDEEDEEDRDKDDDQVYRCQWRLEDDKKCNTLFATHTELRDHHYTNHAPRISSPIDALD
ncbi:hypothetical protein DFP72DRAFT_76553 [Ephemerocybe angulata]|uniref:C2H2-type domain-containing protein n=1 Tax=Ephemerocybe angulata TaxID=980116 RepID=A0A8H6I8N6_9AGAR|nr:hypothetical protein DFP72DRAFT_76553 [Tulosesus angulatus]